MNLFNQLLSWLRGSTTPGSPTIGDRLLLIGADYLRSRTNEAQAKANVAKTSAPASNAPGAKQGASEAPLGQTLSDLLKATGQ